MNNKSFLLIDGHALAYRSFYALERTGMKTTDNVPTWAVYGFFKAIFDLLKNKQLKFDSIAVSFDVSRQTFRTEMYPEYKANRVSMPDSMHTQLALIIEGLKAFNIPIYTKDGYEADDIIGTISKKCKECNCKLYILTGDRDSFQLIDKDNTVTVIMPVKGELIYYDWDKVFEKMGVYPNQIVDFKALSGDTSDNIPGVKGIGDKTAIKLLLQYGSLEEIYKNLPDMQEGSIKTKLTEDKDTAFLSQNLALIRQDVDIDFDFLSAKLEIPDYDEVIEFFRENQFFSFMKNAENILKLFKIVPATQSFSENQQKEPIETPRISTGGQMQFNLSLLSDTINESNMEYNIVRTTVDNEEKMLSLTEKLSEQKLISIDVETTGLNPLDSDLVGISVAYSETITAKNGRIYSDLNTNDKFECFYIPVFHQVGTQLDYEYVISKLKPVFENKDIAKVFQNLKFDYNVLRKNGIIVENMIFDTMLASYIKDSTRKHGLKVQASEHLNYFMKHFDELDGTDKKNSNFESVSITDATNYSCDDAFATLALSKYWQNTLDEKELELLYSIEVPTAIVLADMEYNGVAVDIDYLINLSCNLEKRLNDIEAIIYEQAGMNFNINSPRQVSEVLFGKLNLKSKVRGRTKFGKSTNAKVLEDLASDNKIARDILEQRHLTKLKTTYIDTLSNLILPSDCRIHASFNQTVTSTGRLSSSDPNLQNIPVKTELGNQIRGAFIPQNPEDFILSADYSQIELRLLAHISRDDNLIEAFCNDEDIHSATAAKVNGVAIEEVTKEMRSHAKAVNFGIVYGQSKYGLAQSLKISTVMAQDFILKYFQTYPMVKKYMDDTIKFAYDKGYVETLYGRKRYLMTDLMSSNANIREGAQRAAINAPIQGTAADIMKLAMVRLSDEIKKYKLKSKIIIQVHDEVVIETVNNELDTIKEMVVKCMQLDQPFLVPLKIDVAAGKSWKEI